MARFYASWWGETKDSGMVVKECINIGFVSHAEFSVALSWCWVETMFMLVGSLTFWWVADLHPQGEKWRWRASSSLEGEGEGTSSSRSSGNLPSHIGLSTFFAHKGVRMEDLPHTSRHATLDCAK